MNKISAFIIAKNESQKIARAINSIKHIVDEIIVVDSGSSDNTILISENLGAKVIYNPWPGYIKQKTFAEKLCKNDWVLNIDADEELSQELQDEIEYVFTSDMQNRYRGYKISLVIIDRYSKGEKPKRFAPSNLVIRLYNRKFYSFENNDGTTTHDAVVLRPNLKPANNTIYTFNEIAYHRSGSSIAQLVEKANFYSGEQAKDLINTKREISNLRITGELFFAFFKAFFIRRYFIFGLNGFIDSMIFAFARFIRLAKVRELRLLEKQNRTIDKQQ